MIPGSTDIEQIEITYTDKDRFFLSRTMRKAISDKSELKISRKNIEELAKRLLPSIKAFYESEEGQRRYAEWEKEQQAKENNENNVN